AVHRIGKSHQLPALARHAKTQSKWFSRGGAAVALGRGEVPHSGIEKPSLLRARSLAFSGMCRGKIAVGKSLLENSFGRAAVKLDALGLLVFFVPPQVQPLQSFKNGIDGGFGVALNIGVVEAQNHGSAIVASVQPVEDE